MNKRLSLFILAALTFSVLIGSGYTNRSLNAATQAATAAPDGTAKHPLLNPCTGQPFTTVATGAALQSAEAGVGGEASNQYQYVVNFTLADNNEAHRFSEFTVAHIGQQLAIVLDGEVVSAPTVQAALTTGGQIVGNFTREAVLTLAAQLQSGALPFALEYQSVEATKDGSRLIFGVKGDASVDAGKLDQARLIVEKRLAALAIVNVSAKVDGGKIVVDLPASNDPSAVISVITQPGLLEFVDFSKPDSCAADMPAAGLYILTDVQISRRNAVSATPAATSAK